MCQSLSSGCDISMLTQQSERRARAADELGNLDPRLNAPQVVDQLSAGLTRLREMMIERVQEDVQRHFGMDTVFSPPSQAACDRQMLKARWEIEFYSILVASDEAAEHGATQITGEVLRDWLFRLRMEEHLQERFTRRIKFYDSETVDERRLKFQSAMQRVVPESSKTPLVLFRLFPRAVRIVSAVAFGQPLRAQELRAEQCRFLPAVGDCHECHGRVMDNGESCSYCGNPVWKFSWLLSD